jgi:hypothetical protein
MGTQGVQTNGVLPWPVHCARAGTRDVCPALAAVVAVHYLSSFVPIAQQAGQAVVLGHLSLNVCLWVQPILTRAKQRYFFFFCLFLFYGFTIFATGRNKFSMICEMWIVDVVDSS